MWWNVGVRNARYNSKQILYYLRKYTKVPTCTQTATIRPNISVADDVFYKVVIFLSDDKKVFLHCGPRGHGFLIDRRATAMYRSHDISRTGLANPRWYYGNSHITVKYYILTYPKYHISQNTAFFFLLQSSDPIIYNKSLTMASFSVKENIHRKIPNG